MDAASTSNEKIMDALKLLEEAAKEKKDDIRRLVTDKYHNVRNILGDVESDLGQSLATAKKRAVEAALHAKEMGAEKAKQVASNVDEHVHENPWPYIGGVALASLLLGFILGRSSKHD